MLAQTQGAARGQWNTGKFGHSVTADNGGDFVRNFDGFPRVKVKRRAQFTRHTMLQPLSLIFY